MVLQSPGIVGNMIPKSVKCIHSAAKEERSLRVLVGSRLLFDRVSDGFLSGSTKFLKASPLHPKKLQARNARIVYKS